MIVGGVIHSVEYGLGTQLENRVVAGDRVDDELVVFFPNLHLIKAVEQPWFARLRLVARAEVTV